MCDTPALSVIVCDTPALSDIMCDTPVLSVIVCDTPALSDIMCDKPALSVIVWTQDFKQLAVVMWHPYLSKCIFRTDGHPLKYNCEAVSDGVAPLS